MKMNQLTLLLPYVTKKTHLSYGGMLMASFRVDTVPE